MLNVSGDGLKVVDDETRGLIVDQTIEKVSFCAPDRNFERGFSYICRDGTTRRWMCHGFFAIKESVSIPCGKRKKRVIFVFPCSIFFIGKGKFSYVVFCSKECHLQRHLKNVIDNVIRLLIKATTCANFCPCPQ